VKITAPSLTEKDLSQSIYRYWRYVITDEAMLKKSATKLPALYDSDKGDNGS
jgi:hypothetical protein